MTTGFSGSSSADEARAVAIDSDGKIVVAGYAVLDTALARYNANGSLDTGFGARGRVISDLSSNNRDRAQAMEIQPNGKIVVAGYANNGTDDDIAVARYETDGSPDTGFGTNGKTLSGLSGKDRAYAMALLDSAKIFVAGEAGGNFVLKRFNANGSADTGFQTAGKITTHMGGTDDVAYAVAVQSDGKIVLAGNASNGTNGDFALARYNANGTLDTTFSSDGKVLTDFNGGNDIAFAVAVQPNGKIVVAGYAHNGTTTDFALVRYNADGTLDAGFGTGGKVITPIGDAGSAANAMELLANGKIVVAGYAVRGGAFVFALARYNVNGALDTGFDADGTGKALTGIGASDDRVNAMALQSDGKIVAVGPSHDGAHNDFAVARYLGEEPVSNDATLSGLSLSASSDGSTFDRAARLKPAFAPGTTAYTALVQDDVTHVQVTPTANDARARITVNGQTATSGSAGGAIAVTPGSTTVSVVVTASDGATTETYTISFATVSTDATLSGLSVSASADGSTFAAAELRPDFAPRTTSYRAAVEDEVTHVKVTPTTTISGATVTVNGATVASGSASAAIAAVQGASVTVVVTGTNGSTTVTYTVELAPPARGIRLYAEGPTTVLEGESARVWVSPPILESNVSIPVTVTAGTAESGDYQELTSVATVASQHGGTGVIRTYHDADQDDETFTVSLDESMVVALGLIVDHPNSVTFTIRDDDKPSPVSISVLPDPVRKGLEGQMREGESAQIVVVIAESKSQNVSIPITVTSSSGESGDYSAPSSIVIRRGETVGTGALRALQDADAVDEILTVSLGSNLPALATAGTPSSAQITVKDDEAESRVFIKRIEPDPVPEGETAYVVLGISPTQPQRVTIPITFTHLTSESGDFRLAASITFDAGQPEGVGELRALQDSDADDERLNVELGSDSDMPDLVTAGSPSVREVTIEDDEAAFEVIIKRIEPNPVREGETAHVVLGISPTQPQRVTIPVTFTHGSSESGDFRLAASITFDAGQPEAVGDLRALQDSDSDDETLTVALGSSLPDLATAGTPSQVQVTIDDDEFVSRVWFKRVVPEGVPEGDTAGVVLGIEPAQPERVTIPVTITHVSSEAGDFQSLSSITFAAGQPEAVGEIRTRQDSDEDDEVLEVALGSSLPALVTAGTPTSIRVTIKDDDGSGGGGGGGGGGNDAAPQQQPLPRVERGNASLEVTWITKDDHSPYTGFDVAYRQKGTTGWTDAGHSGTARRHTIISLTNGTTYQVRVRAKIGSAEGPWSYQIAEGTPVAPPAAPTGLTVSAANRQQTLDVSWTAPSGEVTIYRVEYREAGSQEWLSHGERRQTSVRIYSLDDGTTYNVRVRALIDSIEGPWATASGATRPAP